MWIFNEYNFTLWYFCIVFWILSNINSTVNNLPCGFSIVTITIVITVGLLDYIIGYKIQTGRLGSVNAFVLYLEMSV